MACTIMREMIAAWFHILELWEHTDRAKSCPVFLGQLGIPNAMGSGALAVKSPPQPVVPLKQWIIEPP